MKLFGKKKPKAKASKKSKPTEPKKKQPDSWTPPQKIPKIEIPPGAKSTRKPPFAVNDANRKEFIKTFRTLTSRRSPYDIWSDFITMFACAISNSVDKTNFDQREALYLQRINRYSKAEQKLFPELAARTVFALEENLEQDFLGSIFMELGLGNTRRGQFFTPYNVCKLMAEMSGNDIVGVVRNDGYATINDSCCGSGAMLIANVNAAKSKLEKVCLNFQYHIMVTGQDIDPITVMMAYIQLSLMGVAGYFKVGNSLTEPMSDSDSLENYWFTPMYFSDVWCYRHIFRQLEKL